MGKNQTDKFFDGFAWAVPICFADPLAACKFDHGDILYDTPLSYEGPWRDALKHINFSIQVISPPGSSAKSTSKDEESLFSENWNHTVLVRLTDYKKNEAKRISTTQGRLYSLLWKNDLNYLDMETPVPPVPILAMQILNELRKTALFLKKSSQFHNKKGILFLMPYDRTQQLLNTKFQRVQELLASFIPTIDLLRPAEAGLLSPDEFAPSVFIASFFVESVTLSTVEKAIMNALYKPSKDKKSEKEQFRISAHGHIEAI